MNNTQLQIACLDYLHRLSTVTGCEIPVSACTMPDDREASIARERIRAVSIGLTNSKGKE